MRLFVAEFKSLQIKAITSYIELEVFPSVILGESKVKFSVYLCNYHMTHILCYVVVFDPASCVGASSSLQNNSSTPDLKV